MEKLRVAFAYGADAAYMGFTDFSLRANAQNFSESDLAEVQLKRTDRKKDLLYHEHSLWRK